MSGVDPPKKALRMTLTLDGHDRADLADALRQLALDVASRDSASSVSSRGWTWVIERRSELTAAEYKERLTAWFEDRRRERG